MEKLQAGPKIGADGLTKKQRKALKVQENGKAPPAFSASPPAPIVKTNKNSHVPAAAAPVKNSPVPVATAPVKKSPAPAAPAKNHPQDSNAALTEKQLRKLEWEKKLAEQNKSEATSKSELSKAELKAKRREQQETQRQAKLKADEAKPQAKPEAAPKPQTKSKPEVKTTEQKVAKKQQVKKNLVQLVGHLYVDRFSAKYPNQCVFPNVHRSFVRLGAQYGSKAIMGSKARSIAFLEALRDLVKDIDVPPQHQFIRYFESVMKPCMAYLNDRRPVSVSITNAWRSFKVRLEDVNDLPNDAARKEYLLNYIKLYIAEELEMAGKAISIRVNEKIADGDVILTYSHSSVVCKALISAHHNGKRFRVIIIDGRPCTEGRTMLYRLHEAGIDCTYFDIDSLYHEMRNVSKVLMGAHALSNNGCMISRIGSAQVAAVAKYFNKPVMFCCETYKFTERIQSDAFVFNELGSEKDIITIENRDKPSPVEALFHNNKCSILSLMYDVAPPDIIKGVATEISVMPSPSAPVVLRFKPELYVC